MSETKKTSAPPPAHDKRRLDNAGNPRNFSEDTFVGEPDLAPVAAEAEVLDEAELEAPKPAGPGDAGEVEGLKAALEAARARVDTLARAYQEVEREKEEFKRRVQRERERMLELEKGKVALLVIEAIDELELCLKNADDSPMSVGIGLIHQNLLRKLKESGVVVLALEGTAFNPNLAEAIDLQMVDNPDDNMKILEVLSPAYALKEQVIRPGRVRVGRHVPVADA